MAHNLKKQLKELGCQLESSPSSKDSLLNILQQAITILSDVEQSPPTSILDSMQPFLKAIVGPELLKHQDKDVKVLVASCFCEILRITAPEAPYSDEILKDIFVLIVGTFSGLGETCESSFERIVITLETLARYRSCVVMLDLECDDLVSELFKTLLTVARDDHPENVLTSMRTILYVLLDESEDIHEDLLLILLSTLGRNTKDNADAGRKLAMSVIEHCAVKLEPAVKQFLISLMTGENSLNSEIDYREVIYNLYRCSPKILSGVVPYLTGELLNDNTEARLKAVNLVGELFALPDFSMSETFQSIFVEFLKRLTDRVVEVRMSVLDYVKRFILSNPLRPEAAQIFASLNDRLLDYDENMRKQVVAAVCDVACYNLDSVPVETAKLVAERLRDKSVPVKKYTLDRLAELFRLHCLRSKDGGASTYTWIPGKILRCFYDKDFRSDAIESILCGALFPSEFEVKDIVKQWIQIFAGLDKVEVKALEKILEQKQRFQQEMQKYLSLKQTYKDAESTDYQKKVIILFRVMSRFFVDPSKAEEGFLALDQLKDTNVWNVLRALLDSNTDFHQVRSSQDELRKILGENHQLFDFLNVLSVKCSYMLFSKEHVKEFLLELAIQNNAENTENCLSCVNMLVILASYCSLVFVGSEEDLLDLLRDDNEIIIEGILHVLARAGGTIREQLASLSSSVDIILERLCLEGTRRQAKYAVHALAVITKDDGLRTLSVLYKRLVDMLDEKAPHLPTVLQSLGCIAQTAMAIFETRESEIVEFIKSKILQCNNKAQGKPKARWRDQSELCLLKIYGIKTMVKSYLPVKDAHLRGGIDSLIEILKNMLSFGDYSQELESSSVDKAHLKLASAKAILRLSRYWENNVPVDVFHLALRAVEIPFHQARKLFLSKVHQYIKDRILDPKYACAFLLDIVSSKHADVDEDKRNLVDVIQMCHQVKSRQLSMQSESNSLLLYPENILPYLVHALAHHTICPSFDKSMDAKALEPIYRVLYLLLSMTLRGDEDNIPETSNTDGKKDAIPAAVTILQCIKRSEDVVEPLKSKNSYVIAELGLLIVNRLSQKSGDFQAGDVSISLPSMLYKPTDTKDGANVEAVDAHSWLDNSVLSHFQSLTFEVNGSAHIETPQDEVLEDVETEGNEIPLGKLIKRIKSQKNKSKTVKKDHPSPVDLKNDDILKVVREINLDNLASSSKIEASNGHDIHLSNEAEIKDEIPSKKNIENDSSNTFTPKRRRSLSARRSKFPSSGSAVKPPAKARSKGGFSRQEDKETRESDLVTSPVKRKRSSRSPKQDNSVDHEVEETNVSGQKKLKAVENDKGELGSNGKSSITSDKKRKSRSVAGLAKCTSKEGEGPTTDLVDCRINVWWPMDKCFYGGVVKSYDPEKKKHVVLYDDGDVEVLNLGKERWELVDDGNMPKKKENTAKSPAKTMTPKKKSNISDKSSPKTSNKRSSNKKSKLPDKPISGTSGKRPSKAKGKDVKKKTSKSDKRDSLEEKAASPSDDVENRSNISNAEPSVSSGSDRSESGDVEKDLDDVPVSQKSNAEENSQSAESEEREAAQIKIGDSGEVAKPSPETRLKADGETSPRNSQISDDMETSHEVEKNMEQPQEQEECDEGKQTEETENNPTLQMDSSDAEDEPLSAWKQRVTKTRQ